jgi:hydrogenase-4 component B
VENTWGCGYAKLNPRMEYTGSSLVNSITFLFGRILERDVIFEKPEGLFPDSGIFRSTGKDKIEETGIQPLIDWMRLFLQRFSWIQHGNLQHYIWYGLIFMVITIIFALRG